jgi:hypothetical protein
VTALTVGAAQAHKLPHFFGYFSLSVLQAGLGRDAVDVARDRLALTEIDIGGAGGVDDERWKKSERVMLVRNWLVRLRRRLLKGHRLVLQAERDRPGERAEGSTNEGVGCHGVASDGRAGRCEVSVVLLVLSEYANLSIPSARA